MRNVLVLCACLFAAAATLADDKDSIKQDDAKLQGKWVIQSVEIEGHKSSRDDPQFPNWLALEFKQGTLIVHENPAGPPAETTYELQRKDGYLSIDAFHPKGHSSKGICKFESDKLLWCQARKKDSERPSDFTAPAGSNRLLTVWVRAKD